MSEAHSNWVTAKTAFETAKTSKARREAAEDMEFWSNKMAAETIAESNGWK